MLRNEAQLQLFQQFSTPRWKESGRVRELGPEKRRETRDKQEIEGKIGILLHIFYCYVE